MAGVAAEGRASGASIVSLSGAIDPEAILSRERNPEVGGKKVSMTSGGGGIRTHERLTTPTVFKILV
jgi:hypothetical protein